MATVLLVDDDLMILEFCNQVLTDMAGLHVLTATNGSQAVEISAQYPGNIQLLISDISMPGPISGIDVAERLVRSRPDTKVLLMSGLIPDDFVLNSSWQFLAKPFRPLDLLAKVEALLAGAPFVDRARGASERRPPQRAHAVTFLKRMPARK